jgi:hypothetical protein
LGSGPLLYQESFLKLENTQVRLGLNHDLTVRRYPAFPTTITRRGRAQPSSLHQFTRAPRAAAKPPQKKQLARTSSAQPQRAAI